MLVGDDAFPLKPNLLKPYPHRGLDDRQIVFNYRLSRARRVSENAFGILVNRFRVLSRTIHLEPDTVRIIVECCLALHNFLRTENDVRYSQQGPNNAGNVQLGRPIFLAGNNSSERARRIRNELKDFFWSEGQVSWQWEHIEAGRRS